MPRKRHDEDENMDEELESNAVEDDEDDDEDDEDTIDLDTAEEEEEDDDDVDDDDDDESGDSVETIERKKLFQAQAEEVLETLTLDDVKDVLKEYELETSLASKLKKLLVEVINEGEVFTMDDAWEEAIERLEE